MKQQQRSKTAHPGGTKGVRTKSEGMKAGVRDVSDSHKKQKETITQKGDQTMELIDYVNAWMKSQKDFMENWLKSQKDLMESSTEATKKLQESLMTMGGSQTGQAKVMFAMYNSWLTTLVNYSKGFTDEAGKIQENWKNTVEKQMEMSKEMVKRMSELFKQSGEKK